MSLYNHNKRYRERKAAAKRAAEQARINQAKANARKTFLNNILDKKAQTAMTEQKTRKRQYNFAIEAGTLLGRAGAFLEEEKERYKRRK